jgi:hypothetical protein
MKGKKFAALAIGVLLMLSFLFIGLYSQVEITRGQEFECYKAPTSGDRIGCPWHSGCRGDNFDVISRCIIQCYYYVYDDQGNKTDKKEKAAVADCNRRGAGGLDEWDDGGFWEWWFFCI